MSSKLNVSEIVKGHFVTLKGPNGRTSYIDILVFAGFPILTAILSFALGADLNKEVRSLLVNFGAIFTALLLSVLVLVYDQESNYSDIKINDHIGNRKKALLRELYYNISYSIVCSIGLVIFSMLHSLFGDIPLKISIFSVGVDEMIGPIILTPIVTFFSVTIFLNVLMVVKRMHVLLTS